MKSKKLNIDSDTRKFTLPKLSSVTSVRDLFTQQSPRNYFLNTHRAVKNTEKQNVIQWSLSRFKQNKLYTQSSPRTDSKTLLPTTALSQSPQAKSKLTTLKVNQPIAQTSTRFNNQKLALKYSLQQSLNRVVKNGILAEENDSAMSSTRLNNGFSQTVHPSLKENRSVIFNKCSSRPRLGVENSRNMLAAENDKNFSSQAQLQSRSIPRIFKINLQSFNDFYNTNRLDKSSQNNELPLTPSRRFRKERNPKSSKKLLSGLSKGKRFKVIFKKKPNGEPFLHEDNSPENNNVSFISHLNETDSKHVLENSNIDRARKSAGRKSKAINQHSVVKTNANKKDSHIKNSFSVLAKNKMNFSSYFTQLDQVAEKFKSLTIYARSIEPSSALEKKTQNIELFTCGIEESHVITSHNDFVHNVNLPDFEILSSASEDEIPMSLSNFVLTDCPVRIPFSYPISISPPYVYEYKKGFKYCSYWMDCIGRINELPNLAACDVSGYFSLRESGERHFPGMGKDLKLILSIVERLMVDINAEHKEVGFGHSVVYH